MRLTSIFFVCKLLVNALNKQFGMETSRTTTMRILRVEAALMGLSYQLPYWAPTRRSTKSFLWNLRKNDERLLTILTKKEIYRVPTWNLRQSNFCPCPNGFDLQHIQITTAQPRSIHSLHQFLADDLQTQSESQDKSGFDLQHIQITTAHPRSMHNLYQFLADDKQKQWHSQEADKNPINGTCAKCCFLGISANNWLVKLKQARVRSLTNQWFWQLAVFAFSSKSSDKWLFLCCAKWQNKRIFVWLLLFCPMLSAVLFSGQTDHVVLNAVFGNFCQQLIVWTKAGTGGCMILHVCTASPVRSCSMQGVDVDKKL